MSAPLVKFKTGYSADNIKQIEVVRETAQCVWVYAGYKNRDGSLVARRAAKCDNYDQYHDTWEVAHAFLLEKVTANITACRRALERANGRLGNIKGMKPPKEGV
jgi:hypothetical protein